jgi:hypothetical protein
MGKTMCTLPFAKLSLQMSVIEEQAKELGVDAAGSARTLVAEVLKMRIVPQASKPRNRL